MKKWAVFTAVAAMAGQLATPALAASPFANSPFGDSTIYGQQRIAAPAAMAYVRVPFHAARTDAFQPRAGVVITAPQAYRVGEAFTRTAAPGIIDLGFTGRDFTSPWTATVNVSGNVAWAEDPKSLPKNTHSLFESGTSWIVVGLLSVGIAGGVYALSERK